MADPLVASPGVAAPAAPELFGMPTVDEGSSKTPRRRSTLKDCTVRMTARAASWYLRNRICLLGKQLVWDRLCVPHLSWRPIEAVYATRDGARFIVHPSEFIENRLMFFGVWEPNVTALFRSLVRPGDVVLDVGANIGYYALLSSSLVGAGGQVYAVEPATSIRRRLTANMAINGVSNVTVLPYAAWDQPGEAEFHVARNGNLGASSLRALESDDAGETERVKLARLQDSIPPEKFASVSLIKLDIEGAEMRALRGLEAVLEASPRVSIIAEVNPQMLAEIGDSAAGLIDWLGSLGFAASVIPNSFDADAYFSPTSIEAPVPLRGVPEEVCYLLFRRAAQG